MRTREFTNLACTVPGHNRSHLLNESSTKFNRIFNSSAASSGIPIRLRANETGIYTASYALKSISESHQPYTKSSRLRFANATSGIAKLTSTGVIAHPSGAGVSKSSWMGTYTRASIGSKPITSLSGRLPYTKSAGALFLNNTSAVGRPTGTVGFAHPSGTGAPFSPSGKPTASGSLLHPSSPPISGSGHPPYTRSAGAMFTNTTSGAAVQTALGVSHPSVTGKTAS